MRGLIGVLLAVAGAVVAAQGSFQAWQHGRVGAHIPLHDVFGVPGKATASPAMSAFLLVAAGIVVAAIGVLKGSAGIAVPGGVLALVPIALPVVLGNVALGDLQQGGYQVAVGAGLMIVGGALRG